MTDAGQVRVCAGAQVNVTISWSAAGRARVTVSSVSSMTPASIITRSGTSAAIRRLSGQHVERIARLELRVPVRVPQDPVDGAEVLTHHRGRIDAEDEVVHPQAAVDLELVGRGASPAPGARSTAVTVTSFDPDHHRLEGVGPRAARSLPLAVDTTGAGLSFPCSRAYQPATGSSWSCPKKSWNALSMVITLPRAGAGSIEGRRPDPGVVRAQHARIDGSSWRNIPVGDRGHQHVLEDHADALGQQALLQIVDRLRAGAGRRAVVGARVAGVAEQVAVGVVLVPGSPAPGSCRRARGRRRPSRVEPVAATGRVERAGVAGVAGAVPVDVALDEAVERLPGLNTSGQLSSASSTPSPSRSVSEDVG